MTGVCKCAFCAAFFGVTIEAIEPNKRKEHVHQDTGIPHHAEVFTVNVAANTNMAPAWLFPPNLTMAKLPD